MTTIEFIYNYGLPVLLVVAFAVVLFILYKKGYKNFVKQICFYLVCEAEAQFGGGTGTLKFAAVTSWLYERLPVVCKLLFTQKQIDAFIEEAVTKMKEWLKTNDKAQNLINEYLPKIE